MTGGWTWLGNFVRKSEDCLPYMILGHVLIEVTAATTAYRLGKEHPDREYQVRAAFTKDGEPLPDMRSVWEKKRIHNGSQTS